MAPYTDRIILELLCHQRSLREEMENKRSVLRLMNQLIAQANIMLHVCLHSLYRGLLELQSDKIYKVYRKRPSVKKRDC